MIKKRRLLLLSDYEKSHRGLFKIQADLKDSLNDHIFEISDKTELYYEAIKRIKPLNKSVKKNFKSINSKIEKLIDYFEVNRTKSKIYKVTGLDKEEIITKEKNPLEIFEKRILGYNKVPSEELKKLKLKVEIHLRKINNLINYYESLEEVKDFLDNRNIKRKHSVRVVLDFYNRCLKERQTILNYYLEEINSRALEKSTAHLGHISNIIKVSNFFEQINDFPYESGRPWRTISFDHREIDCASHRLKNTKLSDDYKVIDLYKNDKNSFYRKLFRIKSKKQIFLNIEHNLKLIPIFSDKSKIFLELKRLFNSKKWLPFYALALPQVEGLFAEMGLSKSYKVNNFKSLPDKVKSIRSEYFFSDFYFDYYEYILPNERNKFSHTGHIDDIEFKAYDILTDLEHILDVYTSLENPLVQVSKIINKNDVFDFVDSIAFSSYFELLEELKLKNQFNSMKTQILEFNLNFLKKECSISFLLNESINKTQKLINDYKPVISFHFRSYSEFDEIEKIKKPELDKLLKKDDFKKTLDSLFNYYDSDIDFIISVNNFFKGVKKYIFSDREISSNKNLSLSYNVWQNNYDFIKSLELLKNSR